jgi:hypothetical protein
MIPPGSGHAVESALAAHHARHPDAAAAWVCEAWLWMRPAPRCDGGPAWWVGILSRRPDGPTLASTYCQGRFVGEAEAGIGKQWTILEFGHLWPVEGA